jgi:hypothetical protein
MCGQQLAGDPKGQRQAPAQLSHLPHRVWLSRRPLRPDQRAQ